MNGYYGYSRLAKARLRNEFPTEVAIKDSGIVTFLLPLAAYGYTKLVSWPLKYSAFAYP